MSRLTELLRREKLDGAADPVRLVMEDRKQLELEWKREDKEKSRIEAQARKAAAGQEAALDERFEGLLRVCGAREALQEMRKVWGGRVDRAPYRIKNVAEMLDVFKGAPTSSSPRLPALGLALRQRFQDVAKADVMAYGEKGYKGSSFFSREMILTAIVGFDKGEVPYVATFYGSRAANVEYYLSGDKKYYGEITGSPNYCLSWGGKGKILQGAPDAPQILESQLLRIHEQAPSFRTEEARAIERIQNEYDLPGRLRNHYSPFLQNRVASRMPVVNLFLG